MLNNMDNLRDLFKAFLFGKLQLEHFNVFLFERRQDHSAYRCNEGGISLVVAALRSGAGGGPTCLAHPGATGASVHRLHWGAAHRCQITRYQRQTAGSRHMHAYMMTSKVHASNKLKEYSGARLVKVRVLPVYQVPEY